MSLDSYLQNLRAKPDHEKKRFAFWTSFGFTAVLFVFWLTSFTSGLSSANSVVANTVEKADTPAQSLVASVSGFFGDIVDYFITPKTIEYSQVEVVPGDE